MLPWQLKKLHKRTTFLAKFVGWSFVLHVVGAFCLLFVYKGYNSALLMQVRSVAPEVNVRLVAFKRRPIKTSKKGVISKRTSAKKVVPKKKQTQLTSAKKQIKKSIVQEKQVVPQKIKQPEKKVVLSPKVKPEAVKQPIEKKEILPQEQRVEKVEEPLTNEIEISQKELNALQMQTLVQESVANVWTPPAGMRSSTEYIVNLSLDWEGKLIETVVEKKSGVVVYDITVERALREIKFPRVVWGKTMTVAFKP